MLRSEKVIYQDGDQMFEGVVSWNDALDTMRPGIMIAHAFGGQSDFDTDKSIELAKLGYVGFAIDMYGQGVRASDREEAAALMKVLDDDRTLLSKRINLALRTLKGLPFVDSDRTAAIGFCFGGKCVLDLARSGADTCGVVSFHGIYDKPNRPSSESIKASVLVLHGWEDPLARPQSTVELADEMTERKVDWQILTFGQTGHAFTNPQAEDRAGGMFFNPSSNSRAWQAMDIFLNEIFDS